VGVSKPEGKGHGDNGKEQGDNFFSPSVNQFLVLKRAVEILLNVLNKSIKP